MPEFKKSGGFKMKSGNKPGFKQMGSSPAKDMKTGSYEHSFESPAKQRLNKGGEAQDQDKIFNNKGEHVGDWVNGRKVMLNKESHQKKQAASNWEPAYPGADMGKKKYVAQNKKSPAKQNKRQEKLKDLREMDKNVDLDKGENMPVKRSGFGPSTAFGGVKNPELTKTKKPSSKKVFKDGPKNRVHYHNKPNKVSKDPHWQPYQSRGKKSPAKQTDSTNTAENKYWYKIDGKTVTKAQYLKHENKPGNMEGGGKQTNHPDVYGKIANNHGRRPKTKK